MDISKLTVPFALAAALACAARADTWYFDGNEANADTGASTDPTKWKSADGTAATAFSAADTYVLTNLIPGETSAAEHCLRVHGGTFANGGRLELNSARGGASADRKSQRMYLLQDCTASAPAVFTGGLLFGHNAWIQPAAENGTNAISGIVNVVALNGGQIPRIQPLEKKNATLVFNDSMTGSSSGLGMYVFPASGADNRNFTVKFLGDVTWGGEMYVRDWSAPINLASCEWNVRLMFGDISFAPTLRIDGNGAVNNNNYGIYSENTRMRIAVDAPGDTVTFKNGIDMERYPFHCDTFLEFPVDAATGKAGKMVLEKRFYGSTNEYIGVVLSGDMFNGSATNRFALLSVPVANPLSAASFHLVSSPLAGAAVKFEVVDDATWSTLYAVVPPTVQYVQSDSASQFAAKGTHIASADGWSDGSAPQRGKDYVVLANGSSERILRTPDSNTSASYEFPGHSLSIASNASLRVFLNNLRIDDLRMMDGSALYCTQCGGSQLDMYGNIDVSGTVRAGTYTGIFMNFNNSFTGSGTIDFAGTWIAANANANYRLYGASPEFTGKMVVRTAYRDANITPGFDIDCGTLSVTNGNAFGANLPEPTPDAIVITDYAMLTMLKSFTIAKESNRGITVGTLVAENGGPKVGRLWTSDGMEMRIETSLTVDGVCYKQGLGTLTLAGTAASANGDGTDRLVVSNGLLRVAGARAINGFAVHFAQGTRLMVEPNLDDVEFTAKGVDVSALDVPITLDPSFGGKLPLVSVAKEDRPEAAFGTMEYGLFTVKADSADSMRAMLPNVPPAYFGKAHVQWTESSDDVAGTVTFGVRCTRSGLRIVIR